MHSNAGEYVKQISTAQIILRLLFMPLLIFEPSTALQTVSVLPLC